MFAYPAELDEWLNSQEEVEPPERPAGVLSAADVRATAESHAQIQDTSRPNDRPWSRRRLLAALAVAAVLVGAAALSLLRTGTTGSTRAPARIELKGWTVFASDRNGSVVWATELPEDADGELEPSALEARLVGSFRVDLDDDHESDWIALVGYADPGHSGSRMVASEIYCIGSDGELRWRYRPDPMLMFADEEFAGPWMPLAWAVTTQPAKRVWVALAHRTWWPAFVMSFDRFGEGTLALVSAGHVFALQAVETEHGSYLLAGGINNEWQSPALAVLDSNGLPVSSPQSPGTPFECRACPTGRPMRYFVFPNGEVNLTSGTSFVAVNQIERADDSGIVELSVRQHGRPRAVYRLSSDLRPHSVGFSDAYWTEHRQLSDEGKIDHDAESCPERTGGVVVRVWEPETGWRDVRVPPTFARTPAEPPPG